VNPVRSEIDWQTEQMLKQMVRDVNYSFINGSYQLPVDNTTARKTSGLLDRDHVERHSTCPPGQQVRRGGHHRHHHPRQRTARPIGDLIVFTNIGTAVGVSISTNYYVIADSFTTGQFKISTTRGGTAVDITTAGTVVWPAYASLTKDLVDQMLQTVYDAGGITEAGMATLLVGSAQRRKVTAAYTTANYVTKELQGNLGGVTVDRIQTDFGILNVMLDRLIPVEHPRRRVDGAVQARCSWRSRARGTSSPSRSRRPAPRTGAQIYGEVGLQYGNQAAHGKMTNLQG
jgi:hypothetical protein